MQSSLSKIPKLLRRTVDAPEPVREPSRRELRAQARAERKAARRRRRQRRLLVLGFALAAIAATAIWFAPIGLLAIVLLMWYWVSRSSRSQSGQ